MASSRPSKKNQARLIFTPVPSSSPAAGTSNSRTSSNVRYDTPRKSVPPSALSRTQPAGSSVGQSQSEGGESDALQLPTPGKSSQPPQPEHTAHDDHKHTAQLQVSDRATSAFDSEDDLIPSRPRRRRTIVNLTGSEDSEDRGMAQSSKSTVGKGHLFARHVDPTTRRSNRLQERKPLSRSPSVSTPIVLIQSPVRMTRSRPNLRRKSSTEPTAPTQIISDSISILGDAETSGDEEDALVTKPTQRVRTRKPQTDKDDFIVSDDTLELRTSEDEEDSPQASHRLPRGRHQSKVRQLVDSGSTSSDEADVLAATPSKRRRKSRPKISPGERARQEEVDLEEDLEDLQDSVVHSSRTRGAPVNSARDKYRQGLLALQRSRAAKSSPTRDLSSPSKSDNEQAEQARSRSVQVFSEEDSASNDQRLRPNYDEDLDKYEEDFISDNDEQDVDNMVPLEFSSWATAKPRAHFRNVIEWLVKNKIAPAFPRSNELFYLSFRKIDDEVKGQAGSRFISAAWKVDFKRALEARPDLQAVKTSGDGDGEGWWETCQACGRSGHPATWSFQFQGGAYHHDTLEPVGKDGPDSSDDSNVDAGEDGEASDRGSIDSQLHVLLPRCTTFPLGRTCAANASVAHKLSHWKFHLNQYILDLLRDNGLLAPEAIVERDSKSQRKREKEAETFVDGLEMTGETDDLWRTWKRELEGARSGMEDWEDADNNLGGRKGKGRSQQQGQRIWTR